ncbi:hypothetical protein JW935_27320 [candidate division KSB1 bacterium]|nr:hypothetical protein [candidate division KSB1 bacterium]
MRFFFYIIFGVLLFVFLERILVLIKTGEIFKENALRDSFRKSGQTLWQGMKMFVVVWLLYLLLNWWMQSRH